MTGWAIGSIAAAWLLILIWALIEGDRDDLIRRQ